MTADEAIAALFTLPVSLCIATPSMYGEALFADEAAAVARAIDHRRRAFAAGRGAARMALASLGVRRQAIPIGQDRAPIWPQGFVGSISHCTGFCVAVAARREDMAAIGIDVEVAGNLPPGVEQLVCRPEDIDHFALLPRTPGVDWPKLAFSAKEAFYKAYYPVRQRQIDYQDVAIRFLSDADTYGRFQVVAHADIGVRPSAFLGRWRVQDDLVFTGVGVRAGEPVIVGAPEDKA